jgi:2-polyprenyl-3-methyl-5-hydroxy-6-metoxy-1,4-benzoquinol methylase
MLKNVEQAQFIERDRCINCGSARATEIANGSYADKPLAGFLAADPWGENPLPFLSSATWSLVQCEDCSQMFHRRILDEEWNERRFSQWMNADAIKEFEARLGPPFERNFNGCVRHTEHILRIEGLTRGLRGSDPVRLLDFGCGFGSFIEACGHFGFDAHGVDRSIGRRSTARAEIHPSLDKIEGKFHCITLFEVLEHLDHPAETLRALTKFLIPSGILVLETPDCTGLTDIRTKQDYLLAHPLEHINCFTHDTLKSIAERQRFAEIARGPAFVSTEIRRVGKRAIKHLLGQDGKSTQLYFRSVT